MEEQGEAESTDAPGRVNAKELDEADNLKYYSVCCVCVCEMVARTHCSLHHYGAHW